MKLINSKLFPEEIQIFIQKNVKGLYNKELTELVNKTFNTTYKPSQIKSYKNNNHISSGLSGQFEKGQTSWNKGKKMSAQQYKKCKATMFKKGSVPPNHKPVGSERISRDGYVEIKVAEHKPFVLKHHWIWEQANGPIPKGYIVTFLNQDKTDVRLENLALISKNENLRMNQKALYFNDEEKTKSGLAIIKLDKKIKQIQGYKHNIPTKNLAQIKELVTSGYEIAKIAEIMNIKKSTAQTYLRYLRKEQDGKSRRTRI